MTLIKSLPTATEMIPYPGGAGGGGGAPGFDIIRGLQLANDLITNVLRLRDATRGAIPARGSDTAQNPAPAAAPAPAPATPPSAAPDFVPCRADKLLQLVEAMLEEKVKTGHGDENAIEAITKITPKISEVLALLRMVK